MVAATTSPLGAVQEIEPIIRAHADESERERRLAGPIADAMFESGMFKLLSPVSLGGRETDPVTFHRVVEDLARIDGSSGWCVHIAGAGAWGAAGAEDETAEEAWGGQRSCGAGAFFPFGRAQAMEGGFKVNGRWPYASGAMHATRLGGFCNTFDGDTVRMSPFGMPEIRSVSIPASEARIFDTWHVNGLAGTGSHDIAIEDKFVAERYTSVLGSGRKGKHFQSALYNFPFMGFFATPIAAVALGIARGAVQTAIDVAQTKVSASAMVNLRDRPVFQLHIADAISEESSARAWLYAELENAWRLVLAEQPVSMEDRARLMMSAANATRSSARAVELAYIASGGSANYLSSPLQRSLRDIHAVTQHAGTSPHNFEATGKVLLGLPPDSPFLLL
jgi:indole-3-acetate monooxygenase